MICDMKSIYRPRNKKVRFYCTESSAEFDDRGFLCGLNKEDLSEGLADKIMELSPYLQEVFSCIQKNIHYQENAKEDADYERKSRLKRGFKEVAPGIWEKNGYKVKEFGDYPVNLEEQEKERK